jgi:serine/threonine-protein kinase PpkA
MRFPRLNAWLQVLVLVLLFSGMCSAQETPVKIPGNSVLPLRVLARPFSNIYADVKATVVKENVPAFQAFYVYPPQPTEEERQNESGWYHVGTDNRGTIVGWMQAKDVFEWKQTLCLAFTNPALRSPVLLFDRKDKLEELIKAPTESRRTNAKQLYQGIGSKQVPADFPVKSVEPSNMVDIQKEFYLLPILDFQDMQIDNREGRLLRLAAVTRDSRNEPPARDDNKTKEESKNLELDILWVVDTTLSMQPYIDMTLDVVKNVSQEIAKDSQMEVARSMHFGIWGYRDCADEIKGIEYTTRNFTPQLQSIDQFVQTLANVKATNVDSVDWAEDVFSGVLDAATKTKWTMLGKDSNGKDKYAARFIFLVGDAPSHEFGHKWNLTGMNENALRLQLNTNNISLFALFIKDERGKQFHEQGERQFKELGNNGNPEPSYWSVDSKDREGFMRVTTEMGTNYRKTIDMAQNGSLLAWVKNPALDTPSSSGQPQPSPGGEVAGSGATGTGMSGPTSNDLIVQMIKACVVKWLGSQAGTKAPNDITAWAIDKDLLDPSIQSLDVRVLLNKVQLDSLKTVLQQVETAAQRGQYGGEDFFTALQATVAATARDPSQIKNAPNLRATGLVPEFLLDLPYKSRIMDLTKDSWASMSPDQQTQFLNDLDSKLSYYRNTHDAPQGWVKLNEGDDPDEFVFPISLEALP